MKRFRADLHIHTALSPCASDLMTPPAIVRQALERQLAIIAICDHNSARNVRAVQQAANGRLTVLAGMELTTEEEAHIVCVFPDVETAEWFGNKIRGMLPEAGAKRRGLGEQQIIGPSGEYRGRETSLLSAATSLTLPAAARLIKDHQGLAIAAHLDRPSFSVLSQLGFFPPDAGFDAIELTARAIASNRVNEFETYGLPIVVGSDSHFIEEIGQAYTIFDIAQPTFAELVLALQGREGRRCGHV